GAPCPGHARGEQPRFAETQRGGELDDALAERRPPRAGGVRRKTPGDLRVCGEETLRGQRRIAVGARFEQVSCESIGRGHARPPVTRRGRDYSRVADAYTAPVPRAGSDGYRGAPSLE